jgi:valyl-tRNA synthetase
VNAKDERYTHLHGKKVTLPLMNREIPIILDELANPEFGTGAVKVTPAHDPNDFQAGLRHNLPQIDVMDERAHMNQNAGPYAGLDRFEARKRVVADLETQGFLVGIKHYTISLGKCDRSGTVVEPRLSEQWFVKIEPLAKRAIEVVEKGYIRFTPDNYKTIYLNWMYNIHDWCISRQLWWGHRIPAWRCGDCGEVIVARATPTKCTKCGGAKLEQDTDVLDTWFSSALLPFTTLGWPEATRDLDVFYPTSLLITGFDILFFWVARMIMMGCWFMMPPEKPTLTGERAASHEEALRNSVPFREVYIHALVRDAERQKMSKTKGNVLDPIEVIEQYGTDATRFTLAAMAAPGTDIAFNPSRTEGYRNFANKIWNAALHVHEPRSCGCGAGTPVRRSRGTRRRRVPSRNPRRPLDSLALQRRRRLRERSARGIPLPRSRQPYLRLLLGRVLRLVHRAHQAAVDVRGRCRQTLSAGRVRQSRGPVRGVVAVAASRDAVHHGRNLHAIYDGKPPLKSIALAAFPQADPEQIDLKSETHMAVLTGLDRQRA